MGKINWDREKLESAARDSFSYRQVLRKLGLKEAGGNYKQIKKYFTRYKISAKHFKGRRWNKGLKGIGSPRIPLEKILRVRSDFQSHKLKNRLFAAKLKSLECEICGWAEKSVDGRVPVELDHINGDSRDNRLENLRILCPNCHSLQVTHRGRNRRGNNL